MLISEINGTLEDKMWLGDSVKERIQENDVCARARGQFVWTMLTVEFMGTKLLPFRTNIMTSEPNTAEILLIIQAVLKVMPAMVACMEEVGLFPLLVMSVESYSPQNRFSLYKL